jgi:hypothetical protein
VDKLRFYDVDKDYIDLLSKYDSKLPAISYNKYDKFVCGIVLDINDINYYAPISSFNLQQKQISLYIIRTHLSRFMSYCTVVEAGAGGLSASSTPVAGCGCEGCAGG